MWWIIVLSIWLVGGFVEAVRSWQDLKDEKKREGLASAIGLFFFILVSGCPFGAPYVVKWIVKSPLMLVKSLYSLPKGDSTMLRKLLSVRALITIMALNWLMGGVESPNLMDKAVKWYNAPPAPPTVEAQKLISNLEQTDKWKIGRDGCLVNVDSHHVVDRDSNNTYETGVSITPEFGALDWINYAHVKVNGSDCSGQFSISDRRAINKAASSCFRALTVNAMNKSGK